MQGFLGAIAHLYVLFMRLIAAMDSLKFSDVTGSASMAIDFGLCIMKLKIHFSLQVSRGELKICCKDG